MLDSTCDGIRKIVNLTYHPEFLRFAAQCREFDYTFVHWRLNNGVEYVKYCMEMVVYNFIYYNLICNTQHNIKLTKCTD